MCANKTTKQIVPKDPNYCGTFLDGGSSGRDHIPRPYYSVLAPVSESKIISEPVFLNKHPLSKAKEGEVVF